MALNIRWHAKLEPHNNLVVIHTRGEEVQEYLEERLTTRDGSRFIVAASHTALVVQELQQAGFIVE